ncbi:TMEM43 family protein [bacterium]|nr:TMEM43 family protein [bacterium]
MSTDSFTERSSRSWFGRIGSSIKGILFGLILFAISFFVLWTNEGRSVRQYRALNEGAGTVISVQASTVESSNEGKLVHIGGEATTDNTLSDKEFGIEETALRLRRSVQMFQWEEDVDSTTKKNMGGGTETVKTYKYDKKWNSSLIPSSAFNKSDGHQNPGSMPFKSKNFHAKSVTLGAFKLNSTQVGMVDSFQDLALTSDLKLAESVQGNATISPSQIYIGDSESTPAIGDIRIRFKIVKPTEVSLVALQHGDSFQAYTAENGNSIQLLQIGSHSAESMFERAQSDNAILTWILRGVGFICMAFGLSLIARPLSVVGDIIPFIGSMVGMVTGLASILLAGFLSMVTIGIAWVAYRPILGISVLAVAGVLGLLAIKARKKVAIS